jgi:hypothetical protein
LDRARSAAAELHAYLFGHRRKLTQRIRYRELRDLADRAGWDRRDLTCFEASFTSQNGEDGVIQEIIRRIGAPTRYFIEIGASAEEANCLLLADALGWHGLFVDGNALQAWRLKRKYQNSDAVAAHLRVITPTNINEVLDADGIPPDVDVLSIDVDGNDYWLWDALTIRRPRIVIVEYNSSIASESVSVQPYRLRGWDSTSHFGASLGALRRLGSSKGYRFVHADLSGTNVFFVRRDIAGDEFLPEDEVAHRPTNYHLMGRTHRLPAKEQTYITPPLRTP